MKDKEYHAANFANFVSKTLISPLPQKWMNLISSSFSIDDNETLQAEDQHSRDFPTFRVHFGEYFDDFLPSQAQNPRNPESTESATNEENQKPPQELDVSRFPIISSDEIQELKSVASNKNTSRSTKQWMNVFRSWCQCRHLEYVSIETMAPEELDKVLSKFYAELKKKGRR